MLSVLFDVADSAGTFPDSYRLCRRKRLTAPAPTPRRGGSERTIIHAPLCSAATVAVRKYDVSATD